VLLAYIVLAGGCANVLSVTYYSDPPGAMIYENGRAWGNAPVTLNYQPDGQFLSGGCMTLNPLTARWVSGAEASISSLQACGSVGYNQQISFIRPNTSGREIDAQYAMQLEQNAIQRDANALQMFNMMNQMNQQKNPQPSSVNCRTYVIRNVVHTDCQ